MKPTTFKRQNRIVTQEHKVHPKLPAVVEDGLTITSWKLSFIERLAVLFSGRVWVSTYNQDKPFQTMVPSIESPLRSWSTWGMLSLNDRAWAISLVPVSFLLLWLLAKGMAYIHIPIGLRMLISLVAFFVVPWGLVKVTAYFRKRF